jgi:hypothetical protein
MKAKCPQIWSTNVQRALDIAMQTDVKIHFILHNPTLQITAVGKRIIHVEPQK